MLIWPMKTNRLTAGFGSYTVFGQTSMHWGVDLAAQRDDSVLAAHSGHCILSLYDAAGGNMIALRGSFCPGWDVLTRYAHLASRTPKVGDKVSIGDKIGVQGNTGSRTTGKHLHFECWLLPSDAPYTAAGRKTYALDPVSLCRLNAGTRFDANGKTSADAIPIPEPCVETEPAKGTLEVTGALELFYAPSARFAPIVLGDNRSRRYVGSIFEGQTRFPVRMLAVADSLRWAGCDTPWGLLWMPLIEGKSRLTESAKPEDPSAPTGQTNAPNEKAEPTVFALAAEIVRLAGQIQNRTKEDV